LKSPPSRRLTIEVPPKVPIGRTFLAFTPIPAETTVIPRFSMTQIEAWAKAPEIQALTGVLAGAWLPADITMQDIREMRLTEKYGT
jgi:hypothetical protein